MNQGEGKKIQLPELIIILILTLSADGSQLFAAGIEFVPFFGQFLGGLIWLYGTLAGAAVSLWLVLKGGRGMQQTSKALFRQGMAYLSEIIPGLNALPSLTIVTLINVFVINNPKLAETLDKKEKQTEEKQVGEKKAADKEAQTEKEVGTQEKEVETREKVEEKVEKEKSEEIETREGGRGVKAKGGEAEAERKESQIGEASSQAEEEPPLGFEPIQEIIASMEKSSEIEALKESVAKGPSVAKEPKDKNAKNLD